MAAHRFLRLTPETVWGTYNAAGTPVQIVDLYQADSYSMRKEPVRWGPIRTAHAGNRRLMTGSQKTKLAGNLTMLVHGTQMVGLAPWICATAAGVLPSMTADFCVVMEDSASTKVYSRHLGAMVQQAVLMGSEAQQYLTLALTLVAGSPATITIADFPEPAISAYDTSPLYCHEMALGGLTLGSARTEFDELTVTIKNNLDVRWFENQYASRIKYCGRDVDWSAKLAYKLAQDRIDFENVANKTVSLVYTNGANTLTFAGESKCYFSKVDDAIDDAKVFVQSVDLDSYFDPTAGTPNDMTLVAV